MAEALGITWLGHASVLIEMDGVRLLTDPVLRDRVGPLVRIAEPTPADSPGRIDCVLVSHLHADHADPRSLHRLAGGVTVLAPRPAAGWFRATGVKNVT